MHSIRDTQLQMDKNRFRSNRPGVEAKRAPQL
jgi:hypothetical protein